MRLRPRPRPHYNRRAEMLTQALEMPGLSTWALVETTLFHPPPKPIVAGPCTRLNIIHITEHPLKAIPQNLKGMTYERLHHVCRSLRRV